MSGFRIKIFRNGKRNSGSVISIPESFETLLNLSSKRFDEHITKIFLLDGSLINSIHLIRDNDTLYAAKEDEDFYDVSQDNEKLCTCSKASPNFSSDWVTLNVGGKHFTTTRNTLTRYPDTMLANMFNRTKTWKSAVDPTGAYLIDRCPEYFEPILNFLRNGLLIINLGVNQRGVLEEARFFGVTVLVTQLESELNTLSRNKLCMSREEFVRLLMTTSNTERLRCQGLNLNGADLSYLDLSSINFKHANLKNVNFRGATMDGCVLNQADLENACLDDATLEGVHMKRTNLEGASMKNCKFEATGAKHQKANLEGANLKGANLEGSQLSNTFMRLAVLKNTNMRSCVLREASLAGADLENCDFTGADLTGANLRGANVVGTVFLDIVAPLHMVHLM